MSSINFLAAAMIFAGPAEAAEHPALAYLERFGPPPLMEGIGESSIPVTTRSPRAQRYFDQGLSFLHSFWDFEALRAFWAVVQEDPDCAIGYWGIHRALGFFHRRVATDELKWAFEKATELSEGASEREKLYIRSLEPLEKRDGEGYTRALEELVARYPEDVDARLFLALNLWSGYDASGRPNENQLYSEALLRNLLTTHPEHHGVHHYWIHVTEGGPRPEVGLPSAEKIADLAPSSGHIAHMSGHTFFQVGDYERARRAFLNALEVDRQYMEASGVGPIDHWNYGHNLDYLVAADAEGGRFQEALEWARTLQELRLSGSAHDPSPTHFVSRPGQREIVTDRFALAELLMRYGEWSEAARSLEGLPDPDGLLDRSARAYRDGLHLYVKGMEALQAGDVESGLRLAEALDAFLWRLSEGESEGSEEEEIREGDRDVLRVASLELRGLLLHRKGNTDEAVHLLEAAVEKEKPFLESEPPRYSRPAIQTLGEVQLASGNAEDARKSFEAMLEARPNSGHALVRIARTFAREGKSKKAREAYLRFLETWRNADPERPEMVEARAWLADRSESTSELAVDFLATELDGRSFDGRELLGKVVLLDFWAVWCPPCITALPELSRLDRELAPRGLEVVGIALYSGDGEAVSSFLEEHPVTHRIVIGDEDLAERFRVIGFPTYFLVDAEGRVVEKYVGDLEGMRDKLHRDLERLLPPG